MPPWLLQQLMGGMAGGAGAGGAAAGGIGSMFGMNPMMFAMMMGPQILKQFPAFKGHEDLASGGLLPIWAHLAKNSGLGPFGGGLLGGIKGLLSSPDDD